jgi:arabinofuranosyltransferase
MRTRAEIRGVPLLFAAAVVAFHFGWRAFWFLTDDAFIAFRYVGNSQLGHGYVWNPPPFLPVEGYTSFLWVALLDWIWTLTGVAPPVSSNRVAFGFGVATLALVTWMVWRLALCSRLERRRTWLVALVLLGMVTNANFLVWASSGLETALFNFLFLVWVASATYLAPCSAAWVLGVSLTAALVSLARPDGYLIVAVSGLLFLAGALGARPRPPLGRWRHAWPLVLPVVHAAWRRWFYGEWLPNTYWAKHVGAWPESGIRYLMSYTLEYGLWLWGGLVVLAAVHGWRSRGRPAGAAAALRHDPGALVRAVVVAAVLAHVGYYTFVIGGDHFEYRVYSHAVPLVLVSTVWLGNRLVQGGALSPGAALALSLGVVVVSWPIPWLHWVGSRGLETRRATFNLRVSMERALPAGFGWYGRWFDGLQDWLIRDHAVGKRQREHAVFVRSQIAWYPRARWLDEAAIAGHPVIALPSVGVAGWTLARANVIDVLGLNDHVVARHPVPRFDSRRMTHDRQPPPGYVDCFRPNVRVRDRHVIVRARAVPLTAEDIRACEARFRGAG